MKIKQLIIENIASIEKATINFEAEPLAGADVFLIAGKIGAGKSTILDCICLALYGQTPRLPEQSRSKKMESSDDWAYSDQRRFVRMGAPSGSSTLVFEADGQLHRARWFTNTFVRGPKKGQLNAACWTVENLSSGAVFTKKDEVSNYLQRVIGLDFSQFCRTTMLAQGEFSRFLKSTDQEKADILLKITGVDIYKRIGQAISEATSAARAERDDLQTQLNAHTAMTDEERCTVATQLAACAALTTAYREINERSRANLQWIKTDRNLAKKVTDAQVVYDNALAESKTDDVVYNRRLIDVFTRTTTLRTHLSELKNSEQTVKNCEKTDADLTIIEQDINKRLQDLGVNFSLADSRLRLDNLKDKITAIDDAKNKCRIHELNGENASDNALNISNSKAKIEKNRILVEEAEKHLAKLSGAVEACQEAAESLRLAAGDDADKLRVSLKIGCKCPVCLQSINTLPSSTGLKVEYDKAQERLHKARKNLSDKQNEVNTLKLESKQAKKLLDTCLAKVDELELLVLKSKNEAVEACNKLECTPETLPELMVKVPEYKRKIKELSDDIKKGEAIEKDRNDLEVRKAANDAASDSAKSNSTRLRELIAQGRTQNPDITDIELQDAVDKTDKEVEKLRVAIDEIDRSLLSARNSLQAARSNYADNASKRPDDIAADATADGLTQQTNAQQLKVEALTQASGRLSQRLEADAATRQVRVKLTAALKVADKKYDLHQRLNNLIGDKDGKNFSRIALGYVLGSLIENANLYLRRLTDRYTLRVQPGTYVIMVCDSWQNYTERTVNTTSGGETFLISLALALALSDIGKVSGMDTLFIDEGFGSLSEDELRHAIDALATMHKVSGRQVGIISHVAALRERIPVQIVVDSAPNRPSTISVIGR